MAEKKITPKITDKTAVITIYTQIQLPILRLLFRKDILSSLINIYLPIQQKILFNVEG